MICHSIALRRALLPSSLAASSHCQSSQPASIARCPASLTRYQRANVQPVHRTRGSVACCSQDLSENVVQQEGQKAVSSIQRRDVLLAGAAALVSGAAWTGQSNAKEVTQVTQDGSAAESPSGVTRVAEDDKKFGILKDEINAYEFKYPLVTAKKEEKLPWVETRAPERYSSAAPISSDARQRIVSERIDFTKSITCTVSIGPPSEVFLKGNDPTAWGPTAVANSVLMDRSSRRMSQGQRTAESEVEEAKIKTVDGVPYFYYEHIQQRSPTTIEKRSDTFRHAYAVTAERDGYLYTLNISTPDVYWDELEPAFRQAVESFRLLPTSKEYVPPWKDPWRFW